MHVDYYVAHVHQLISCVITESKQVLRCLSYGVEYARPTGPQPARFWLLHSNGG